MSRERAALLAELRAARQRVTDLEGELARQDAVAEDDGLTKEEYLRYGRQMILPAIGLPGQTRLKKARLLVIGAGGLGCPSMLYLAAAGVGSITVLDPDTVELSNLHRQVLHSTGKVGLPKVDSAAHALRAINPTLRLEARQATFDAHYVSTLPDSDPVLRGGYDVVLDCCDNPATRHFVNAYAVKHALPLVSGGAVRTDGVVGVYHHLVPRGGGGGDRGPCYACMHPPPSPDAPPLSDIDKALLGTGACADEGVLGVTCGIVGITMATETLRVLLGLATPTMHLMTFSASPFRTIKMRAKKASCPVCSLPPDTIELSRFSYAEACVISSLSDASVDSVTYEEARDDTIIDTRPETEFGICHLPHSINVPFAKLVKEPGAVLARVQAGNVTLVCRRGNDSLLAARILAKHAEDEGSSISIRNMRGGWEAYARDHDQVIY